MNNGWHWIILGICFVAIMTIKLVLEKYWDVSGEVFDKYLSAFCAGAGIGIIIGKHVSL